MIYKKKVNKTRYTIMIGDYLADHTDVMFNYTVNTLTEGDEQFVAIHREGGSSIYKDCLKALTMFGTKESNQTKIPEGTFFFTRAGVLKANKIAHCVLPNYREINSKTTIESLTYQAISHALMAIDNAADSTQPIRTIKFRKPSEKITGKLSERFHKDVLELLQENSSKLREVTIVCKDQEEYNLYLKLFLKKNCSLFERVMYRLGLDS